jgi:adenylate cyclase
MPPVTVPTDAWLELPDGRDFRVQGRCTIGRGAGNDLVLADQTLSRQHATISVDAQGCQIADLHSRNGTQVNRRVISRPTALCDGDEILLGTVALHFRCLLAPPKHLADPSPSVTQVCNQVQARAAWLLLLDIIGYATLSQQLGNQAAQEKVHAWIARVRPIIEEQGGVINRYLGDAIFAYWLAEPPARARVIDTVHLLGTSERQNPLPFRLVLHHGQTLFSVSDKGEELSGQEVNFIFRAEKLTKHFQVATLLSATAAELLATPDQVRPLGLAELEGIAGAHEFFTLDKYLPKD